MTLPHLHSVPSAPPSCSPTYTTLNTLATTFLSTLCYTPDPSIRAKPPYALRTLAPQRSLAEVGGLVVADREGDADVAKGFRHNIVMGGKVLVSDPRGRMQNVVGDDRFEHNFRSTAKSSTKDEEEFQEKDEEDEEKDEEKEEGMTLHAYTSHLQYMTSRLARWDMRIRSLFVDEMQAVVVARVGFFLVPKGLVSGVGKGGMAERGMGRREEGEKGEGEGEGRMADPLIPASLPVGSEEGGEEKREGQGEVGVQSEVLWILEFERVEMGDREEGDVGEKIDGEDVKWLIKRSTEFVDGDAAAKLKGLMERGVDAGDDVKSET